MRIAPKRSSACDTVLGSLELKSRAYMDIGERPCELPEESNLVREPGAGDICTDAGTQLLSAVMNNVQALVEGDGDEFDDRELHIVVDEPLPGPRPSWMSEEDAVRYSMPQVLHFT